MECKPLRNLEELFSWEPKLEFIREPKIQTSRSNTYLDGKEWTENNKSWDWLVKTPLKKDNANKPRTLVCHDMMGGYKNDRFLEAVENQDGYSFLHWNSLDIFVYFSHNFITLPPTGWIIAGKTHGVKVLGTIITEWKEGKQILEEILRDESKIDAFVEKCTDIASFYGFQGWLLNIENPVDWTLVPYLLELVKKLTDKTHKLYGDEGMVLWYDSVTIEGNLQWQNELNIMNKPFMDNCDGIFLNYNWTAPDHPTIQQRHSLLSSVQSLDKSSQRTHIFVGIDVFGRGCLGGGGLNSDIALKKIREVGLSTAIFAPGWTYESSLKDDVLSEEYLLKEHLFWTKLEPYLSFHAIKLLSGSKGDNSCESRLIFESNFHTGREKNSFHLLSMQTQPSLPCIDQITMKDSLCSDSLLFSACNTLGPDKSQYSCHTIDPQKSVSNESCGLSLCIRRAPVTVPVFLVNLEPDGAAIIFVIYGNKQTDVQDCQLVLGTNKGEQIEGDIIENEILQELLPSFQGNTLPIRGFLVENCYDTIEKIGFRFNSQAKFNLTRLAIYSL